MSWTPEFRRWCDSALRAPAYFVEVITIGDSPGSGWHSASHARHGSPTLVRGSVRISGQSVQPGSWSSSPGAFSFATTEGAGVLFDRVTRGTVLSLCTGDASWSVLQLQRVAVGVVKSITWAGAYWQVQCWDLWAAFSGRLTTNAAAQQLFYNAGTATALTADYAVGDASISVSSASSFERQTGAYYGILIEPASGDAPFYLRASSKGASTLTIDAPGSDRMGTTRVAAASGSAVRAVAHLTGHPIDVAYMVFGAGSGGAVFDTLPSSWGFGVADEYLDAEDRVMWQSYAVKVASGQYLTEFTVDSPQDDALGWLRGFLAPFAIFPAVREGCLTVRAAQVISGPGYVAEDFEITDADLVRGESWEYWAWDESNSAEAHKVEVHANGTSNSTDAQATFPGVYQVNIDLDAVVFDNASAIRTDVLGRAAPYLQHVPERYRVTVGGLRHASLACGDVVALTSTLLRGRLGRDGYDRRLCFVAQVSPDFEASMTTLDLLIYPTDDSVFGGA